MKLVATHRVEHSIKALRFLASVKDTRASAGAIAEATGITLDMVRQLMQVLARAQLVTSITGPNGGYWLSCVPKATSMKTVVEACEGPIDPMFCSLMGTPCDRMNTCELHVIWTTSQLALSHELSAISLADVFESTAA